MWKEMSSITSERNEHILKLQKDRCGEIFNNNLTDE